MFRVCKAGSLKHSWGVALFRFLTASLHEEEQASPALWVLYLPVVPLSYPFSSHSACLYIHFLNIYIYFFFPPEDNSSLPCLQIFWLSWSVVEGQTWANVLLLLTWLRLAQSTGTAHSLLSTEHGMGSAHLVVLHPMFGTLWLDPFTEKIKELILCLCGCFNLL